MFVTYYPEGNYFVMFYDVFASVTYIIISFSSTLDGGWEGSVCIGKAFVVN